MKVQILATGSSGNSVLIADKILIDAGITVKAFLAYGLTADQLSACIITHRHGDHMKKPLVRYLLNEGVPTLMPNDAVAEFAKEGMIDVTALTAEEKIRITVPETKYHFDGITITPYAQKHHDIINYAMVLEENGKRLLYATDLDTVEATDVGVGLQHLGMFDTIMLEGNYDEPYLREYIEHMISLVPEAEDPRKSSDMDLEKWVKANYRRLPDEVARNAFRAIQNHRHLSKQQARAYATSHLKQGGDYYEIHRSRQFYEEPEGWKGEI